MKARKVKFKCHNKQETLDIVDIGGYLVKYLANESTICPLIGSQIKFLKEIGEGSQGLVFLIKLPYAGNKEYVAKKIKLFNDCNTPPKNMSLRQIAKMWSATFNVDYDAVINFNGGDPNRIIGKNTFVCIPDYANLCRIDKPYSVDKFDGSGKVIIPANSYLCEKEQYSEYVIGVVAGNIYKNGTSANFFDVFMFSTCFEDRGGYQKISNQFVFMEKIDGIMGDIPRRHLIDNEIKDFFNDYDVDYDDIESIFLILLIQTLHALVCLQKHKIVHGDLHLENVFVEYVTKETKFNGKEIYGNDWYAYKIGKTTLYIPAIPILAKIGDFGLSVKWKKPIVGNKTTIDIGYNQGDGLGPWIPNWYAPNYDAIFLIKSVLIMVPENLLIRKIYDWILDSDGTDIDTEEKEGDFLLHERVPRPNVRYLEDPVLKKATPRNILTNKKLFGKFMKKPKTGKIVTLGVTD